MTGRKGWTGSKEKKKAENEEKAERLMLQAGLEKTWELMRCCSGFIKEHTPQWEKSKEIRAAEKEKEERLERAACKKEETKKRLIQRKILDTFQTLPVDKQNEFERIEKEEQKQRRLELQEATENPWKNWRQKKKKKEKDQEKRTPCRESFEEKLAKIEKLLEKLQQERKDAKEQERREVERRERYIKEKRERENDRIVKEKERKAKLKKKAELEKHWDMLRWITSFIEENKVKWNEQDLIKEQEREALESQTNEEKINILKEQENNKLSREEKIALADTKKKYWTEWRGLKHPEQPGRIPKQRSDEVSQVTPNKSSRGERGGGEPEKRAKPPLTPQPTSIVGDMKIGSAEINYAHCAERLQRKFQISVYRAYENSERLGTVKEENLPLLPPQKRAYKKVTIRNSNHEISPCMPRGL